jgi:hypothetical protein
MMDERTIPKQPDQVIPKDETAKFGIPIFNGSVLTCHKLADGTWMVECRRFFGTLKGFKQLLLRGPYQKAYKALIKYVKEWIKVYDKKEKSCQ